MISKRQKRYSQPQENLRQFSLNNSKGIDSSKAVTDVNTILHSKNLIVNSDGSLSLRKPIKEAKDVPLHSHADRVYYTHDPDLYIVQGDHGTVKKYYGISIHDKKGNQLKFTFKYVTVDGEERTIEETDALTTYSHIGFDNMCCIPLNTSTVLSGIKFNNADSIGMSLEPSVYRYLQITKTESTILVQVVTPSANFISKSESDFALSPNMLLDYVYSLKDNFKASFASVRGIVMYGPSQHTPENPAPVPVSNVEIPDTLRELSEKTPGQSGYRMVTSLAPDWSAYGTHLLRAFCDVPQTSNVYAAWFTTEDGVHWNCVTPGTDFLEVSEVRLGTSDEPTAQSRSNYERYRYVRLDYSSNTPPLESPVVISPSDGVSQALFKIIIPRDMPITHPDFPMKKLLTFALKKDSTGDQYPYLLEYSYTLIDYYRAFININANIENATLIEAVYYIGTSDPIPLDFGVNIELPKELGGKNLHIRITCEQTFTNPKISIDGWLKYITKSDVPPLIVDAELSRQEYTLPRSDVSTFAYSDLPNAAIGNKLYHNASLYSYGDKSLGTNILVTNAGEFTTPATNTIDVLGNVDSYVTTLLPWRDYLISATQYAMYLHIKQDVGWITKTITTSAGISGEDSKCCVPVLNGVIFKSGTKLYQLYPNLYSGSDTMLNLTELSKPVEDILIEHSGDGTQFAFSTESEYILMLPDNAETHCLRYNYSLKHWSYCTYPVKFYGFKMYNVDNVHLYGHVVDGDTKLYTECIFDADVGADEPYGDTVETVVDESLKTFTIPIPFSWDTGQKTDSISNTRQFVESKLMFATLSEQDSFPFKLYVAIDGDPHVITKDVSTDAPFWKPSDSTSLGVLNTNFRLGGEVTPVTGAFNTLRQLIVRYSGKGKSIRHVIEGESLHNFKLYETYVRYKNLNIKQ